MEDTVAQPVPRSGEVVPAATELLPLVRKGVILTLLTLGIYRFWYRTNLRRWYRTNTIVDGDALAFHGTAKELFIGFLIAVAIFAPLYGLVLLAGVFAGEKLGNVISVAYGAVFLTLAQFGFYRARRYRLTRTSWRGLRFDQVGSAWRYAAYSLGYMLLTVLSFGILFPLMRLKLEAHRIRHTRFGTAAGSFDAPLAPLMKRWLVTWVLMLTFVGGLGLAAFGVSNAPARMGHIAGPLNIVFLPLVACLLPTLPMYFWVRYVSFEFLHFANHTKLGDVAFRSSFPIKAYIRRNVLFVLLCMGLVVAAGMLVFLTLRILVSTGSPIFIAGVSILVYLGAFVLFSILKELLINRRFWELACESLTLGNIESVDQVIATALSAERATGEGLADALDFGGM
jgi:uncharacterized membrane protein YjgN (DUF898 family)